MSDTTIESRTPAPAAGAGYESGRRPAVPRRADGGTAALCDVLTELHAVPGPLPDHLRPAYSRALLAALNVLPD